VVDYITKFKFDIPTQTHKALNCSTQHCTWIYYPRLRGYRCNLCDDIVKSGVARKLAAKFNPNQIQSINKIVEYSKFTPTNLLNKAQLVQKCGDNAGQIKNLKQIVTRLHLKISELKENCIKHFKERKEKSKLSHSTVKDLSDILDSFENKEKINPEYTIQLIMDLLGGITVIITIIIITTNIFLVIYLYILNKLIN
jgi:hypothetical protein